MDLPPWIGIVVGVACIALGTLGVTGRMDESGLALYSRSGWSPPPEPELHRKGQRVGGGLLLLGGVVFLVAGLLTSF